MKDDFDWEWVRKGGAIEAYPLGDLISSTRERHRCEKCGKFTRKIHGITISHSGIRTRLEVCKDCKRGDQRGLIQAAENKFVRKCLSKLREI